MKQIKPFKDITVRNIENLKRMLRPDNIQLVLFDLVHMTHIPSGDNGMPDQWGFTIKCYVFNNNFGIIDSDKAFADCDDRGDSDGMFTINHDGNAGFYVPAKAFGPRGDYHTISLVTARKIFDFVEKHLAHIKDQAKGIPNWCAA